MKLFSLLALTGLSLSAAAVPNGPSTSGTPADIALANPERIAYWLQQRQLLAKDASELQKQQAVQAFINAQASLNHNQTLSQPSLTKAKSSRLTAQQLAKQNPELAAAAAQANKTVKVLTLLIDFPDLKHDSNGLKASDTDMFYSSYSVEHYQSMLYGQSTFTGPKSENLLTARAFYDRESNNSFTFNGQVHGWYTAANNAAYYGAHNGDAKDKNASELVKEAVTAYVATNPTDLDSYDSFDPYDVDGDGNTNEPDGIIDYLMVFHSSIGEEAGGGVLGDDAIWSHRFYLFNSQNQPLQIGSKRYYDYTIQPIDAAIGVCVHEFGHALGLPDEYDLNGGVGSPVEFWSVMSGGSWAGRSISGSQPVAFSAYAREKLQGIHGGNWARIDSIDLESLNEQGMAKTVNVNSSLTGNNLLKINLTPESMAFKAPYSGQYQYYSGEQNEVTNTLSKQITLPTSSNLVLSMMAHWEIEQDYDYVQVLVNGTAITGNHTTNTANPEHSTVTKYISGKSSAISGNQGTDHWVNLSFDLSAFSGQTVTISIRYKTDAYETLYGFVADDLKITNGSAVVWQDNADSQVTVDLNGFSRIDNTRPALATYYLVEQRKHTGNDSALQDYGYHEGVLMWYINPNYTDNNSSDHPGYGYAGVVDNDQNLIKPSGSVGDTFYQLRDAALRIADQPSTNGDNNLQAVSRFNDSQSYQSNEQPQAGMILPQQGLEISLTAVNNASAEMVIRKLPVQLTVSSITASNTTGLTATFSADVFSPLGAVTYLWEFGDSQTSTEAAPSHTYVQAGRYSVKLTVTDTNTLTASKTIEVAVSNVAAAFTFANSNGTVNFTATASTGVAPYSYSWDFGDSATATTANPTHQYALSGTYTVKLTVTDATGKSAVATQLISVVVPMTVSATSTKTDLTANFTASATGGDGNYQYAWQFGDGQTGTGRTVSHSYSQAGSYTVTLTVTDGLQNTQSYTLTVSATAPVVKESKSGGGGSVGILSALLLLVAGLHRRTTTR